MKTKKVHLTFAHCDSRVLHGPTQNCKFCNDYPERQALREAWGIAFTGQPDVTETYYNHATGKDEQRPLIPCPSERDRSADDIHRWHGNRPQAAHDDYSTHKPGSYDGSSSNQSPPLATNNNNPQIIDYKWTGHYHLDGTFISWDRPGIPQCQSMHGGQQCQWQPGHTGPHQECNEVWNHD